MFICIDKMNGWGCGVMVFVHSNRVRSLKHPYFFSLSFLESDLISENNYPSVGNSGCVEIYHFVMI